MKSVLLMAAVLVGMAFAASADGGYALAQAPYQGTIAAGSDNDSVYVYDPRGNLLWSYSTGADVVSVAVSSDGAYIAVGSEGNKLYLFDRSGTKLWEKTVPVSYGGNWGGKESKSVAISADGEYVVAGCTDNLYVYKKDGTLHWSHAGAETSVAISPDGNYVASANKAAGTVDFFSIASSTPLWSTGDVDAFWVATSDPGYVAVGPWGDTVYLYDNAGTQIWSHSHAKWVGSDYIRVDMPRDGLSVVAVNDDAGDTQGCVLAHFDHLEDATPGWSAADATPDWDHVPMPDVGGNDYRSVAISGDGEIIATGPAGGTVVLSRTGALLQNFMPPDTKSIDLTSDGQFGAYGEANGRLSFFSPHRPTPLWTTTPGGYVLTVALGIPPSPVGGIAEPADVDASALAAADSPGGSSSPPYAAIAGAAAAVVAIAAGGWYARRRWVR